MSDNEVTPAATPPNAAPEPAQRGTTPAPGWERDALRDLLTEQLKVSRANRRWRWLRFISFSAAVVAAVWWVMKDGAQPVMQSASHTAVVTVSGVISSDGEANAEDINQALRAAFEDEGAKAVVLLINSPGGSPVQAGIVSDEMLRLKAIYKKPLYAVIEETGASAAYYIAASADDIFVDKASVVGSIGVLMDGFGFTDLMQKLGIERRLMTAGENKGFLDPFSETTPRQKAHVQRVLNQIHAQFIEVVRAGRGTRLQETEDTFSGLFWTGEQAVELGLADQLGGLDYVAREVAQAPEIIDYTLRENVAERLVRQFGAAVGAGAVRAIAWSGFRLQ
ncbi:MAG: S49 family peptidase [Burkholderiaceae bacterium]|jgi:protease-4|nr:S49 family peptidase [Burkholderiaceae bacterium]MDO7670213.1 S49 family peptidase [Burkholderiaceae bacterium]MDO7692995.1 S49 family peptidase [Burkholderiaceae bacterium]MDO7718199.1 S49 family peptidase [Burkholderiaceae bacterium]MDP4698019.1 S49 family peptidase [Burkholderiaceae bacterium]